MVPPLLTSLDVDVWALAFAAFVTLVSVALAGLSAAHVTQWDRATEDDDSGWVAALAERTKSKIESSYPRLTKATPTLHQSKLESSTNVKSETNRQKCHTNGMIHAIFSVTPFTPWWVDKRYICDISFG